MEINTTAHYGLIAAAYIAEHGDKGCVAAKTISVKYDIPLLYLLRIMNEMVKANVLVSKRGRNGGYVLARPAKEITLLEVVEAAGGPVDGQLELAKLAKKAPFSIEMEKVFVRASEKAASILSRAKLSQMAG